MLDKKIAIVCHNALRKGSGQGRINYELVKYLAYEKKSNVDIYAEKIDNDLSGIVKFHKIKVLQKPGVIRVLIFATTVSLKLLLKKYDMVHIDSGCAFTPYNTSICHICHTACLKYEKGWYHRCYTRLNSGIEKLMYRRKNGIIIAVSKKVKTELEKHIGVNPDRIKIIYNGVNTEEFNTYGKIEARRKLIEKYNLPENSFLLLFVGDLIERKGIDFLFLALKKTNGNNILLVAGKEKAKYIKKVKKYGLHNRIIFMGFRQDIADVYKGANVFIFPTLYDSFGNVVLEAMASGLPVIVSRFSGVAEIIDDGINGFVLRNPQDIPELVEKIHLLEKNQFLCEQVGLKARETAKSYSWNKMMENIVDIISKP